MVNYSQSKSEGGDDFQGARPVLRTLYDHTQAINDIDFHPTLPLLASASRDNTIKFYDYHSSMKKSFKYMQVRKKKKGSVLSLGIMTLVVMLSITALKNRL